MVVERSWSSGFCLFVLESGAGMLPSVRGLATGSAAALSSVPNFAQRRPPGLPV